MSRDAVVAKRYAKALFELASSGGNVSEIEAGLKLVVEILNQNEDAVKVLSSPNVALEKKAALVESTFGAQVPALVLNTIQLIIVRGRQSLIADTYEAFVKIAGDALGQAHAVVYSAKQLSDEELAGLSAQFGQIEGKKIVATQVVAPELLGGVQVRIGDRLYDGSLSGKLERLQKSLKN